jgi:hypothetical protein
MTAAGASSLLVARGGLGALDRPAEAALYCSLAWITLHLDDYSSSRRERILYPLLAREGRGPGGHPPVRRPGLVRRRGEAHPRPAGGGRRLGSPVNTSFRAPVSDPGHQPQIRALPPPRVVTRGAGRKGPPETRCNIDAIDGYVSAAEFLGYLEENADRDLLKVAEQVVRNFPLARQGELVPALLGLLAARRSRGGASRARRSRTSPASPAAMRRRGGSGTGTGSSWSRSRARPLPRRGRYWRSFPRGRRQAQGARAGSHWEKRLVACCLPRSSTRSSS